MALSGTQPEHIKKEITTSLLLDLSSLCSIKLSSNRPNIVTATHPVVGSQKHLCNLDFLVPLNHHAKLKWALIFFDDSKETLAAMYLNLRLHQDL